MTVDPARAARRGPSPSSLPVLPLEAEWQSQRRLWGHSLHPLCSYLASFPAALAHAFIARFSRPGDVVLDPFAGRGTVPLQACVEGRIGVGNDRNPLAHLLTAAKVEPATPPEALTRLATLRLAWAAEGRQWDALGEAVVAQAQALARRELDGEPAGGPTTLVPRAGSGSGPERQEERVPLEVALAFHPRTFGQLLALRSQLQVAERVDRFLAAALLGILHGQRAGYLSPLMPNTFSMAPRYVRRFAVTTAFRAPPRDVFQLLERKLARLYRDPLPTAPGIALLGDARDVGQRLEGLLRERSFPERVRLVIGSPPYLRVVKYGYYNWLRLWFLGWEARTIDGLLDDGHRRPAFLEFLRHVLDDLRGILTDDGIVVLVIGDVEADRGRPLPDGVGLAEAVWHEAAAPVGYRLAGVVVDPVAARRKVTKVWGAEAGQATKVDRILVLGAGERGRRRALAGAVVPVDWRWPPGRLG